MNTSMRFNHLVVALSLIVMGAGCTANSLPTATPSNQATSLPSTNQPKQESSTSVTYTHYRDQETGIAFEYPKNTASFSDGVNGFDDTWKFVHDGDSYMVSFYTSRGDDLPTRTYWKNIGGRALLTEKDGRTVYAEKDVAYTEAYLIKNGRPVSILVTKHEGPALTGTPSSEDDEVFQHLVASMTFDGNPAF